MEFGSGIGNEIGAKFGIATSNGIGTKFGNAAGAKFGTAIGVGGGFSRGSRDVCAYYISDRVSDNDDEDNDGDDGEGQWRRVWGKGTAAARSCSRYSSGSWKTGGEGGATAGRAC